MMNVDPNARGDPGARKLSVVREIDVGQGNMISCLQVIPDGRRVSVN